MTKNLLHSFFLYVFLFAAFSPLTFSQSGPKPSVGEVHFANSGATAAQKSFLRGLAQLHNFQYPQAESLFQEAERTDPDFAMAYWGEALTHVHPLWNYEDLAGARAVLHKLAATPEARAAKAQTPREKEYLRSIEILFGEGDRDTRNARYADALEALHQRYPQDVDAAALYALSLLGKYLKRDYATYMRAAAVLEEYYPANQQHPGIVHYMIHSYDDPVHAPLGLRAARLYGKIAPDSGHALHMTSHIFIAMGMWPDVVQANLEALATHHGDAAQPCDHANSWLSYGYLQEGKLKEAHDVIAACSAKTRADAPDEGTSQYEQSMLAHYIFETQRWNDEFLQTPPPPAQFPDANIMYSYVQGMSAARRGDVASAEKSLERFKAAHAALKEQLAKETHPNLAVDNYASVEEQQLSALLLIARGKKDEALQVLRQASRAETAIPFEFGPPAVPEPTNELLGELLIDVHRPAEAEAVLRDQLTHTPGKARALSLLHQAAAQAGDRSLASSAQAKVTQETGSGR